MQSDEGLFTRMWENVEFFRRGVEAIGYWTLGTTTPIVPLFVGSEALALQMCREAFELGLFTTPAVYPAVPKGRALIRTSVSPAHTQEHLQQAIDALAVLYGRHPLPTEYPAPIPFSREVGAAGAATKQE